MSQSLRTMFYSLFDQKHLVVAFNHHLGLSDGRMVIMGGRGVGGGEGCAVDQASQHFPLTIVFQRMFSRTSQA